MKAKICVADPPWAHQQFGAKEHGAAKAHYAEKKVTAISAVPVRDWTDPTGSLLFLWCTGPQAADGLHIQVATAWGFRLLTKAFTWIKVYPNCRTCGADWDEHADVGRDFPGGCSKTGCLAFDPKFFRGIGFYTQSNSEDVWLGVRGKTPWSKLRAHCDVSNIVVAPLREHSRKPESVQSKIEYLWPNAYPLLELYATRKRPGWTCWGNRLGQELGPEGVRRVRRPRERPTCVTSV